MVARVSARNWSSEYAVSVVIPASSCAMGKYCAGPRGPVKNSLQPGLGEDGARGGAGHVPHEGGRGLGLRAPGEDGADVARVVLHGGGQRPDHAQPLAL